MKAVLLLLSGLVAAVVVFIGGLGVGAYVIAEPEPHRFSHLDTPDLWTAEPVRIDPRKQAYERIAGPVLAANVPASDLPDGMVAARRTAITAGASAETTSGSIDGQTSAVAAANHAPVVDTAQADWCFARYRSYRLEDNSYQPYDGGPRRQCEAPGQAHDAAMDANAVAVSNGAVEEQAGSEAVDARGDGRGLVQNASITGSDRTDAMQTAGASASGDGAGHAEWCSARYRSYRAGDNSYQPFDGGPRKSCQSPFG